MPFGEAKTTKEAISLTRDWLCRRATGRQLLAGIDAANLTDVKKLEAMLEHIETRRKVPLALQTWLREALDGEQRNG